MDENWSFDDKPASPGGRGQIESRLNKSCYLSVKYINLTGNIHLHLSVSAWMEPLTCFPFKKYKSGPAVGKGLLHREDVTAREHTGGYI